MRRKRKRKGSKVMEGERHRIMKDIEEMWRLKIRAIWLEAGDENSIFFQNYVKGRINTKTIGEMKKADGRLTIYFSEMDALGVSHFKTLFKAPLEATIAKVIQVA